MPAPMRAPWDMRTPPPGPHYDDTLEDDGHELSPTETSEGVFKPRDKAAPKRKRTPAPEPVVTTPKCEVCRRFRGSKGPCWFCGDETQVL